MTHTLALLTALVLLTGCANPFKKTVAAVDVTVEHAMSAWGEHVAVERAKTPPNLLIAERQEVKRLYERYQTEIDAARVAYNEAVRLGTSDGYEAAMASVSRIHQELLEALYRFAPQLELQLENR